MAITTSLEKAWYSEKFGVIAYCGEEGNGIHVVPNGAFGAKPLMSIGEARELADMLGQAAMWLISFER